jgi:hypothetical protein
VKPLNKNGYCLQLVHRILAPVVKGWCIFPAGNKKVIGSAANEKSLNLIFLNTLI